ncbi:Alpha/beta hydrolase family protein [Rosistilla carotiformis]|uniref:Alpha/beta hydrolase family protein n=1 Tax=Rosistilla carotiformis TaxID=2528017 RepID=A0A518JW50_9BACT|nr:alpha/beta hydrolase [Rosistilla carotiformis]QDV69761.1 Alpha/beta hydrolase family protein [Rosistilla carotiformis]
MKQRPQAITLTSDAQQRATIGLRLFLIICSVASMSVIAFGQGPAFDPLAPGNPKPAPTRPQPGVARPPQPAPAARPVTPAPPKTTRPTNAPKKKIPEELKPRLEKITTKDGVPLQIGYFPSDRGKKAATVLLVHEWSGQTSPYVSLAFKLQSQGCAVALLDIRGHGRSRVIGADGKPMEVERATKRDMEAVVALDMEAAKKFLRSENDAEKLNLNALTVIGIEEGSILAMNWAMMDWNWPSIGTKKQGQDVKALVLVSPIKSVNGVSGDLATRHPAISRLPIMIVSGSGISENSEANRLAKLFERARVSGKFDNTQPLPLKAMRVRANLSGVDLVLRGPEVIDSIASFVEQSVVANMDLFPWVQRNDD